MTEVEKSHVLHKLSVTCIALMFKKSCGFVFQLSMHRINKTLADIMKQLSIVQYCLMVL